MPGPRKQFPDKNGWTPDRLPDLTGRVYAITGANSGIGLETARMLGRRCAHVYLLCRDRAKAHDAIEDLQRCSPANCRYETIQCDLGDLASVRAAADRLRTYTDRLDGLINNAGIMMVPRRGETADGFERQFGVNHLGHFALSALVSDMVEAAGGRFVTVSSQAANGTDKLDFENLNGETRYSPMLAYASSKLANLLFALELQRKLKAAGCKAASLAAHPGFAETNIATTGPSRFVNLMIQPMAALLSQSAAKGARPVALAAAEPEATPGAYYGPNGWMQMGGRVDRAELKPQALDEEAARRLWAVSAAMTNVSWPIFETAPADSPSESIVTP